MDDPSVGQSSGIKPETANFDQPPRILDNSPTLSRITFSPSRKLGGKTFTFRSPRAYSLFQSPEMRSS